MTLEKILEELWLEGNEEGEYLSYHLTTAKDDINQAARKIRGLIPSEKKLAQILYKSIEGSKVWFEVNGWVDFLPSAQALHKAIMEKLGEEEG